MTLKSMYTYKKLVSPFNFLALFMHSCTAVVYVTLFTR